MLCAGNLPCCIWRKRQYFAQQPCGSQEMMSSKSCGPGNEETTTSQGPKQGHQGRGASHAMVLGWWPGTVRTMESLSDHQRSVAFRTRYPLAFPPCRLVASCQII